MAGTARHWRRVERSILNRPALVIALIFCAVLATGLLFLFARSNDFANDFSVYWRAANEPVSSAYSPRLHNPFPYAPTMLLWIKPLGMIPLRPAFAGWVVISLAVFVAACRPHLDGWTILLAFACPAMVHCLATGQVSAALAALLFYAFATPNRARAGLAFAIVGSIKPQLLLMAPFYLAVNRDWRALIWAGGGFAASVLLSLHLFGVAAWIAWIGALGSFHEILVHGKILTFSITPAGQAEYWGLSPTPFIMIGAAVGVWLVLKTKADDPVSATALVVTGSLLAAPYAMLYDLVPVAPFLARAILRGSKFAAVAFSTIGPIPLLFSAVSLRHRLSAKPTAANAGPQIARPDSGEHAPLGPTSA